LVQAWIYVLGKWPDYLSAAAGAAVQPPGATAGESLAMSGKEGQADEWLLNVYIIIFIYFNRNSELFGTLCNTIRHT
jgi:hypothetical protein